jgi:hypothetical protein
MDGSLTTISIVAVPEDRSIVPLLSTSNMSFLMS